MVAAAVTKENRRSSSRRREPSVRDTLGVSQPTRRRRTETPVEHQQQYVGIDLHRRRSVVVRMTEDGEVLECVRSVASRSSFFTRRASQCRPSGCTKCTRAPSLSSRSAAQYHP